MRPKVDLSVAALLFTHQFVSHFEPVQLLVDVDGDVTPQEVSETHENCNGDESAKDRASFVLYQITEVFAVRLSVAPDLMTEELLVLDVGVSLLFQFCLPMALLETQFEWPVEHVQTS